MRTAYRVVHHTYSSPETAYRVVHHRPEQVLATLEGAQGCLLFSSGIAAADAMLRALLKPGDCLVLPRLGYNPSGHNPNPNPKPKPKPKPNPKPNPKPYPNPNP